MVRDGHCRLTSASSDPSPLRCRVAGALPFRVAWAGPEKAGPLVWLKRLSSLYVIPFEGDEIRSTGVILAVAIALTFVPAAFAQTYIVPDGDCGAIILHATRGTDFPNLGETIGADRVKEAYVSNSPSPGRNPGLRNQRVALKPAVDGPRSLDFNTPFNVVPEDGVVMASVDFRPAISGNETRTEHAKAFIFCGAIAPMADWQRSAGPAGFGLEVYPQEWNGGRPHLKSGDSMWFIAVDKATNKLIRDLPMELYRASAGRIERRRAQ
jgi:hypothetical protein